MKEREEFLSQVGYNIQDIKDSELKNESIILFTIIKIISDNQSQQSTTERAEFNTALASELLFKLDDVTKTTANKTKNLEDLITKGDALLKSGDSKAIDKIYNNLLHKFEENIQKIDNNSKLKEACEIYLQDFKERGNNPNFKKDALLKGLTASVYLSENNNKLTEKEVVDFQKIVENYMTKATPSETAILDEVDDSLTKKTQEAKIAKDTEKREHVKQRVHAPKIGDQEKSQLLKDIGKIPNDKVKNKITSLIRALDFAYKESQKSEKPEELYNIIMNKIVGFVNVVTESNEPDYKECSKIFKALHKNIKDQIPANDKNWNIVATLIKNIGKFFEALTLKGTYLEMGTKKIIELGSSIQENTSPWLKVKEESKDLQKELRKSSPERNNGKGDITR